MWCANCQSEVAAEANPETGEVRCASCGNELSSGKFARLDQNLRHAKELLDRWSREPMLEPYGPLPGSKPGSKVEMEQAPLPQTPTDEPPPAEPQLRLDEPHQAAPEDSPLEKAPPVKKPTAEPTVPEPFAAEEIPMQPEPAVRQMEKPPVQTPPAERQARIEPEHPTPHLSQPHFDIQKLIEDRQNARKPRANGMMMLAGQCLSYLGVLGLTAGASMVVYGYFGGEAGLAPKGWMLTTAGQMLLFLGIVTLISSGMDQASEEMGRKIEVLGEQMLRFEQHTREQLLRGPKIPPEAYGDGVRPPDAAAPPQRRANETTDVT